MNTTTVSDSLDAMKVFTAGAVFLLIGAALGLTQWPLHEIVSSAISLSAKDIFAAWDGYGLIFVTIFWCSRPSLLSQRIVLCSWPVATLLLWHFLSPTVTFSFTDNQQFSALFLIATGMAIPALVMLLLRVNKTEASTGKAEFELGLRYLIILSALFIVVPGSALQLTATLHPSTYDMFALHWDVAAGLNLTPGLIKFINGIPGLPQLVVLAYGLTPLGFLAVALRHLRARPLHVAAAMPTWVVLTSCALIAYNFFPVTGPKYVFGLKDFVNFLSIPYELPLERSNLGLFPRNGMPSMHFGWMLAASILWWRTGTAWWSRAILICMTILTATATLYTGEHYVVDLIVAVPFVLAAIALCTTSVSWSFAARKWAVILGFGTWFAWIVLLRNAVPWIKLHPWASWLMIFATALIVLQQGRWFAEFPALAKPRASTQFPPEKVSSDQSSFERRVGLMFFVSGMAALIYQVLFAKKLALVFGSTATATLTVLATFLGGMAIGSLLGSKLAQRANRPLFTYAIVEALIAGYCLLTPFLFDLVQAFYVALAGGQAPDSSILLTLRVVLGALVLLVPTILMGATLPLLSQTITAKTERMGSKVALLYFANTAGATVGALLSSYAIIPSLGVNRTTLIAAMLNLLVALGALELAKRVLAPRDNDIQGEPYPSIQLPRGSSGAALIALTFGGVLSLGLEVVYVHMLSIVAGNSVYAFGLMLATFLLGLAGGGEIARRLLLKLENDRVRLLALTLLGLSFCVASGVWFWNDIPDYFASFAQHPAARTFSAREAIRGMVCAMIMLPPTLFIGAAYVFSMDIVTASGKNSIKMLGIGAALNTTGNIAGVLLFGFYLLPTIGGLNSTRVIAICAVSLAGVVLAICTFRFKRIDMAWFGAAGAAIFLSFQPQLNYDALSSGSNVYFSPQRWGNVVDHAESIDGGLTTVATQPGKLTKTLLTNGKFQGNDAWEGEMQAQIGFAFAPLMHQEKRDRALVIGYGTGVTSRVFHEAGFKHLDIAELSKDVIHLANSHFPNVNKTASSQRNVSLHITDGRNLLLLSAPENLYDVVSIEITSIWFAGAASLYNKEFYSLVRSRMASDGVLQQWVQLHHLSPIDILSVISSLRAEFQYVSLYEIGGQGILIATNSEFRKAPVEKALQVLDETTQLNDIKKSFKMKISALEKSLLLSSNETNRFIREIGIDPQVWVSTDDNLFLEYSTPKANVNDSNASYQNNLEVLKRFSGQAQSGKLSEQKL